MSTTPLNAHRYGLYTAIPVPVKVTSTVPTNAINPGDLLAQVSGKALPQTAWVYATDEATTQAAFAAAFLGMSNSRSRQGSTDARDLTVEVNEDGVFDVNVIADGSGYALDGRIGVATDGSSAVLATCKNVSTSAKAIARIVETPTIGTTAGQVRCRLLNTPSKR